MFWVDGKVLRASLQLRLSPFVILLNCRNYANNLFKITTIFLRGFGFSRNNNPYQVFQRNLQQQWFGCSKVALCWRFWQRRTRFALIMNHCDELIKSLHSGCWTPPKKQKTLNRKTWNLHTEAPDTNTPYRWSISRRFHRGMAIHVEWSVRFRQRYVQKHYVR